MKIVSFFSYKGGAGRSTLAYNTIPILAKDFIHPTAKNPMIVLDTDIDSCGMTYLLDTPLNPIKIDENYCVQSLLADGCDQSKTATIKEHPFLSHLCPVGHSFGYPENDAILLLPAKSGKRILDNSIANYDDSNNPLKSRMDVFVNCCERMGVSAILLDSAVGDNLSAVISNNIADVIVCCMRPTRQFREGTKLYLKRISNSRISAGKHIVVVPNVVPTESIIIDNLQYPGEAIYHFEDDFKSFEQDEEAGRTSHYFHLDLTKKDCFGIPALTRFMWCEAILCNLPNLTAEEKLVVERYTKLAEIIHEIDID